MVKKLEKVKSNLILSCVFMFGAFYPVFAAKPGDWSDNVVIGALMNDPAVEANAYIMMYNADSVQHDIGNWDFVEYQEQVVDSDWPITIDGGTTIDAYSFCLLGDGNNPINDADWGSTAVVPDFVTGGEKMEQGPDGWAIRNDVDTVIDGMGDAGSLPVGCPDSDAGVSDPGGGKRRVRYNTDGPSYTVGEGYGIDTDVNADDHLLEASVHGDRPHNSSETEIPEWADAGDSTPPAGISSLSALAGVADGTVRLKWLDPGDDGTGGGNVSSYEVKYATYCVNSTSTYASATLYEQSWSTGPAGDEHEIKTVSDLTNGVTYWFAIKATDGDSNQGMWPGSYAFGAYTGGTIGDINCYYATGAPDVTPPCAISNLTALTGDSGGEVKLVWTAPGDDGAGGGDVSEYLVVYATCQITASNFYASFVTTYTDASSWTPGTAGQEETGRVVSGLTLGASYWFAIKAKDEVDNWSSWSDTLYSDDKNRAYTVLPSMIVVINEIAYKGTAASESDEWFEFYNTTDSEIDMAGWSIYGADAGVILNFSAKDGGSAVIPAKGYLIYANHSDDVKNAGENIVDLWDATIDPTTTSDHLILYDGPDGTGNIIDEVDDNNGSWFVTLAVGESMERKKPYAVGTSASNWAKCTTNGPETDSAATALDGTPGRENSVYIPPAPIISTFTPVEGFVGTTVTITGSNFREVSPDVYFNDGVEVSNYISWCDTKVVVCVPDGFSTGKIWICTEDDYAEHTGTSTINFTRLIPPEPVSNLTALAEGTGLGGQIRLKWTAPAIGDKALANYDVRYATGYISESTFNAQSTAGSWSAGSPGDAEGPYVLTGFNEGTTYFFACHKDKGYCRGMVYLARDIIRC